MDPLARMATMEGRYCHCPPPIRRLRSELFEEGRQRGEVIVKCCEVEGRGEREQVLSRAQMKFFAFLYVIKSFEGKYFREVS